MKQTTQLRTSYGVADFIKIRQGGEYYVDKTHYLPLLENTGRFLFLIRPRRFGKSLLQSMMECYYNHARTDEFDALFGDTWIAQHPTPEKNQYMVLRFDFSMVDATPDRLEASFEVHCRTQLDAFLDTYQALITQDVIQHVRAQPCIEACLQRLLSELKTPHPIYLFIDEYDNFTNHVLAYHGREAYRELTHGGGFFKHFFSTLKGNAGRTGSNLSRLFITGVSPLTMDDVTSGFNIGSNISLDARFNGLLGFNRDEMVHLFAAFNQDYEHHHDLINAWYGHYHFEETQQECITNSDMALYFLQSLVTSGKPPKEMIDHNTRMDYGKLRHLIQIDQQLNGNFSCLRDIIETGEQISEIKTSFPVDGLLQAENFVSLLYYFGLLTFAGEKEGAALLKIPNRTIQQLMYGYMRDAYREVGIFKPNTWTMGEKLRHMAYRGAWLPFFDYLAEQIGEQASVRDFLQGEKMIQGFLLAWLNFSPYFKVWSEHEQGGGFVDLYLAPFYSRYPDMRHAYLIELKYISRGKDTPKKRQKKIADAEVQLRKYYHDTRIQQPLGEATLHPIILLYSGWELVYSDELKL